MNEYDLRRIDYLRRRDPGLYDENGLPIDNLPESLIQMDPSALDGLTIPTGF
jgi:hypothetical protein